MPLPAGLQLYITSADGTQRRRLPRAQVETVTSVKERFGGFGQCTVATAIPYQKAPALTIQIGDRVETWFGGQRRYRGYVSAIAPSGEEPRKVVITAFGASALLRKQFCDRSYAFPSGGVDVSAAFAALSRDFLHRATGPGGFRLIQSVQSLPIGTALQALDARRKLAGDVLDALVKEAGNLAVWGVDVDSAGMNRLFLRPLSPASPPVHAIPVPGKIAESASGERQAADIVNQLILTGGAATYENLLHNGGFELPVQQADGAGNLVVNGGFETTTGDQSSNDHSAASWALSGGAQSFTTFNLPPKQAQPYTGNRCLGLEGTSQAAVQVTTAPLTAGHNYCLSVRAAKEMDQQVAAGHALLQVYSGSNGSGTLLLSQTVALTPSGQGYDYFSGTFPAPAGSGSFRVTLACDTNDSSQVPHNNGYSGGLLIDDVQLYDVSVVYQDGWAVDVVDQVSCRVNAVNWVYQDAAFEGGYCVYLDATGTDADGHDLKLQPLQASRFKTYSSQTLRYGVWLKSPPASPNPNPPKFFLEMNFYDSSGHITRTPPRATFSPGFLANWTYFELVAYALDGEVAGDANLTWRSAGSLLVDAQSVRDDQAPPMASGNGSTTPLAPYLPDGPLCYFLAASDPYLNGTWRPANGHAAAAPYAGSEALYGPRCGVLSDTSILRLDDACAVANATFTAQAAPLSRPSVTVVNDPRIYWPGETVNLIGADGPALQGGTNGQNGAALPLARVTDTWDGLLKTRLDMETEQPDVSLAIKRIVQDELRRLGPSGGGGSTGSGGYSGGAGSGGGATSPVFRSTLSGSPTDPTLHDAYTGIPHASAASQAGWTGTTAEVVAARTRTVKGVSSTSLESRLDAMEQDIANASSAAGGGLTITEAVGSGPDMSLTTSYATIPNISIAVAAGQSVNMGGLVELTADSTNGLDDLFVQLYDTVSGAAIANSERHISVLPAGKRGLVPVSKYVAGAAAGRTLVLQARNGTAARGTASSAKSLLQALGVASGTSAGTGQSIVKPASGTLLKTSGTTLTSGLVFLTPLSEGAGSTVKDLVTGSTAAIPAGWAWGTAAEGTVLTNTGTGIGPQFTGITPVVGDTTVVVIATPAAGQAGNFSDTTYFGEQGGGTWTTALDSRGWNACGSNTALSFSATPSSGTEYYVATRSASTGTQAIYSLAGQAVSSLGSAVSSAGNGAATSTIRVVGGGVVNRYTSGNMVFIAQWNRVLTSAEISQLAADPYAMFVGH